MKTRFYVWAVGAVMLVTAITGYAQSTQSPLASPTGYVNDYVGVIDRATKNELETALTSLDRQQQIQLAVAVVDTTGGQDIFDYSLAVARGWGIGSKDTTKPTLLLLVAIKDRKYFTQVSRHLEGDLPDGLVGEIQRAQLVPAFRAGEYGRGIRDTIYEYIRTMARKQGFSTDKIFAPGTATRTRPVRDSGPKASFCVSIVVIVVIAFVVLAVLGAARGRGMGGRRFGGGSGGWIAWLLLSMLMSGRRGSGSSGWSGGGFGGFGGGGGGGGGGFGGFGGGGDFGGGGAGGSW